eukprot:TRINITY_DN3118_c0_g1_i1.p1 TRINITY_DN3118_c0_g1~~TRINITY_DN3118_c0_g1_i1.p1  ORF type:complete len:1910 (+),score=429.54 TRINITY_DN3118_c0_g1_i1:489-6218(+)
MARGWCIGAIALLSLLLAVGGPAGAFAACPPASTVYVAPGGSDATCCTSKTLPCASIAHAFTVVSAGGTVSLAAGSYSSKGAAIAVGGKSVTIASSAADPSKTVLDCAAGSCLTATSCAASACSAVTLSLQGFTVTNGKSTANGGCLAVANQGLALSSMVFDSCTAATNGGAIYASEANVTATPLSLSTEVPSLLVSSSSATAGNGGGMYLELGSLVMNGAVFSLSTAALGSGGNLFTMNTTGVTLTDITMKNGTAFTGGCFSDIGSTSVSVLGGMWYGGVSTASSSVPPPQGGGCISTLYSDAVSINNAMFSFCSTQSYGGALFIQGVDTTQTATKQTAQTVTLQQNSFISNSGSSGAGIAVEFVTAKLIANTFTNNTFVSQPNIGGAIYLYNGLFELTGKNYFTANGATPEQVAIGYYSQGSAIAFQIAAFVPEPPVYGLVVDGATFEGHYAYAGAAYSTSVVVLSPYPYNLSTFTNSYFIGNYAQRGGGAAQVDGSAHFEKCTFKDNYSGNQGGALQNVGSNYTQSYVDCLFEKNVAVLGGGAITTNAEAWTNALIIRCNFTGNMVGGDDAQGGAIYNNGYHLEATNCTFKDNNGGGGGGAVAVYGSGLVFTGTPLEQTELKDCTFEGNSAAKGGAVATYTTGSAAILGGHMSNNNATQGGACIAQDSSDLTLSGVKCTDNFASQTGGCFDVTDLSTLVIASSDITGNQAVNEGGGGRATVTSTVTLTNTEFSQNKAQSGAGVRLDGGSTLTATTVTIDSNVATFEGGAFFSSHTASSKWTASHFSKNSAVIGAAILLDSYSAMNTSGCSFTQSLLGPAVELKGSAVFTDSNSAFSRNSHPSGNGAAINADLDSNAHLSGTKFSSNSALLGGAIYAASTATVTMTDGSFTGNFASENGGAVAVDGSSDVMLSGAVFTSNSASGSGGALALLGATSGSVKLCTFAANQAGKNGGGVFVNRAPPAAGALLALALSNLTFNGSVAPNSQGSAFFEGSYEPSDRVVCANCTKLSSTDSFGTQPTYFRFVWPGRTDKGINSSFTVLASSGDPIVELQVLVLDAYGNIASGDDSTVAAVTPTPRISGFLSGVAAAGAVTIPSISITVPANNTQEVALEVTVSSPAGSFPPITRAMEVGFCPSGYYYSSSAFKCLTCRLGQWCQAGQPAAICTNGTFSFQTGAVSAANCSACEGGLVCSAGISTVLEGYWLDPASIVSRPAVYGCDNSRGCAGFEFLGSTQAQCKPGYESRVCSACSDGYYGFLSTCSKCSSGYKAMFPLVAIVVAVLWLFLNWITSTFVGADTLVVEMQFLAVVGAYNLDYFAGTWISAIFQVFNVTLFFPDFLGPECANSSYSFAEKWIFTAVLPFLGIAFYLVLYLVDDLRFALSQEGRGRDWLRPKVSPDERYRKLVKSICNLLDLLYVAVTIRCFQTFHFQTYDQKVLSSDPTVVWLSSTHIKILPFAVIYLAFYVIGLPLFFSWVLVRGKMQSRLHERAFSQQYGQLYERFEPDYWWWYAPMLWGRRVAYCAVFVFFSAHPDMQVYLTFLLVLVLGLVHYFVCPHKATALDVFVGVFLLGQYLYLLAGTANSYFSSYVSGTPAEAVAGTALVLYLLAAIVITVFEIQELWARFWVRQWANTNEDRRSRVKHPRVPLIALLGGASAASAPASGGSAPIQKGGEGIKDGLNSGGDLVPLQDICNWFNPHVMAAFLQFAQVTDLNLLQMIRVCFSDHPATEEEVRQAGQILDCLPSTLRFSFINELLCDIEVAEQAGMAGSSTSSGVGSSFLSIGGATGVPGSSSSYTASLEKVHGVQRVKELRNLAEAAAGDKKRAGDTLRLLLNPRCVETFTAFLLYDEYEGRRAVKELLTKFSQWLLLLPAERSWLGGQAYADMAEPPAWEIHLRRRLRIFSLKLAL